MSKTILFAAAAAATLLGSLTSFTPTAEAGGIRVGFGLPLGSFTAMPTRGGYAASKSCKKKSPSYASRSSRPAAKVASRPSKETKVASHSYSAPKKSRSVNRADSNDTETAENTEETSTTGSTALIQADSNKADITTVEIPADLPPEGSTPETTTETTVTSTPVANAAGDAEIPAAETSAPAPAPVVEEAPKSKKSKTAKKEDCTKYIPSIGVTVSVGC